MTRSVVATDNFNRADGALGGGDGWTAINTNWGHVAIASNTLGLIADPPPNVPVANWTGAGTWTANQYAKQVIDTWAFDNLMHGAVCVRASNPTVGTTAALNHYYAYLMGNSSVIGNATTKLGKVVNGVKTELSAVAGDGFAIGDTCEIEAEGSTIRVLKNGVVLRFVTDTDIPGSSATPAGTLGGGDNWEGGILVAAAATGPPQIFVDSLFPASL